MNSAIPPIFIVEGRDVGIFASLQDAVLQIEPIDVRNAEYVAYDAQGRLLRLETDGKRITVSLAEEQPAHARELEVALRDFLRSKQEQVASDPTSDLPVLVTAARKYVEDIKVMRRYSLASLFLKVWQALIQGEKRKRNLQA